MNKKGFIAGWTVDVYAYLLACVIVIGFYFIFSFMAQQHKLTLEGTKEDISLNIYANTFINMPVEVEGVKMNMAELLRMADHGSYESEAEEYFDFYWRTVVFGKNERYYIYVIGENINLVSTPLNSAIPSPGVSDEWNSITFICGLNSKINKLPIDNYLTTISGFNKPIKLLVLPSQTDLCERFAS